MNGLLFNIALGAIGIGMVLGQAISLALHGAAPDTTVIVVGGLAGGVSIGKLFAAAYRSRQPKPDGE